MSTMSSKRSVQPHSGSPECPKYGDHASSAKCQILCTTSETMALNVAFLNGDSISLSIPRTATLSDIQAVISKQSDQVPGSLKLILGDTVLREVGSTLAELGITSDSVLVAHCCEPLGQHLLETPDGSCKSISRRGPPRNALNEFQLQSWQAAVEFDSAGDDLGWRCDDDHWGNVGCGVDLYWKTCSDGNRYEYWSTNPGDNEYGLLVRVGTEAMKVIGQGFDDGLDLCEDLEEELADDVTELLDKGWPLHTLWGRDDDDDEDEDDEDEDDDDEHEE